MNFQAQRVALCLSGLPRWVNEHHQNITDMIIVPNNADVFVHSWTSSDEVADNMVQLYKPKKFLIEPQKKFTRTSMDIDRMLQTYAKCYVREMFIEMIYSSWYSIQQANLLKETYRLENDIHYDYVIRCRFDLLFNMPVLCTIHDPDVVHISCRDLPPEMVDDRFAFSSNKNMNAYSAGFNLIDFVHNERNKKDGIFCGETLVHENLKMLGLESRRVTSLYATQNSFR